MATPSWLINTCELFDNIMAMEAAVELGSARQPDAPLWVSPDRSGRPIRLRR